MLTAQGQTPKDATHPYLTLHRVAGGYGVCGFPTNGNDMAAGNVLNCHWIHLTTDANYPNPFLVAWTLRQRRFSQASWIRYATGRRLPRFRLSHPRQIHSHRKRTPSTRALGIDTATTAAAGGAVEKNGLWWRASGTHGSRICVKASPGMTPIRSRMYFVLCSSSVAIRWCESHVRLGISGTTLQQRRFPMAQHKKTISPHRQGNVYASYARTASLGTAWQAADYPQYDSSVRLADLSQLARTAAKPSGTVAPVTSGKAGGSRT